MTADIDICLERPWDWTHKAMAFVIRAHRHLWGKNNEGPLVFLYENGLSNTFCKAQYLGWNKFGQDRPLDGWGLASPHGDTFHIPPGIVIPWIQNKILLSVYIVPMAPSEKKIYGLPGSHPPPMILGNPQKNSPTFTHPLEGLCFYQDHIHLDGETSGGVIITPEKN